MSAEDNPTLNPLGRKMAGVGERAIARPKKRPVEKPPVEQPAPPPPPPPVNLLQIPFWNHALRAAPSSAFRSALFPALGRVKRRLLWDETLFSVTGVTVTFRGEQFDQSDLDVLLEIWHRMRGQSGSVGFAANDMLLALGRHTGKSDHDWLRSVIKRLVDGSVTINDHGHEYNGHLINDSARDKVTKRYTLSVNERFVVLFRSAWSSLDLTQRRALKSPTARSLHAYLSSHRDPGPHQSETLISLAGLTGVNAKTTLKKALAELEAVGFLSAWSVDKHLVTLTKAVDNSRDSE